MPVELSIVIAVIGLLSTCCGIVLSVRSIRNTSPSAALKKWQKDTDEKLDNDNRRLRRLEQDYETKNELDRLVLRSIKGILDHLASGNHTDVMKKLIENIDDYLIER